MERKVLSQVVCVCFLLSGQVSSLELTCETLILLSTNLTARMLVLLNQTFTISNSSGVYCDLSVDGIGTCWPRSAAGELISRPCPEQFNGIHYNTTNSPSVLTHTSWILVTKLHLGFSIFWLTGRLETEPLQ